MYTLQALSTDSRDLVRAKVRLALYLLRDIKLLRRGLRTFEFHGFKCGVGMHEADFIACMYDDDPTLLIHELSTGEIPLGHEEAYVARVIGVDVGAIRCLSTTHFNYPDLLHEMVTDYLMGCGVVQDEVDN